MNTNDLLKWGLRLFFWIVTTLSIRQGSMVATIICVTGFLIIEKYLEDITDEWN